VSHNDEDHGTPEERARAQRLARLVDDMLAGEPAPPAMDADDRALLETATAIHAAMGTASLEPAQTSRLIEAAFVPGVATLPSAPRRTWLRRRGPWLMIAVAVAAAIVLVVLDPKRGHPQAARPTPDQLVGRIDEERSAEASPRLDVVYADRLAGYRSKALGGGR
jgi:hypothetical protein